MNDLRQLLIEAKTRYSDLLSKLNYDKVYLDHEKEKNANLIKARWVINEVSTATQKTFQDRVEKLTTMAIRSVFDRDYEFKLKLEVKRNKPECRLVIVEGREEFDDLTFDKGGGILPIISFALRVVMWNLERPRSRGVLILDEPLKGAVGHDGDLLTKTAMMFRGISSRLGLQLIIITHEPLFVEIADRAWKVIHEKGESIVRLIKGEVEKKRLKRIRRLEK